MAKMYNGQVVSEMVISAIIHFIFFLIRKIYENERRWNFFGFMVKLEKKEKEENRSSVEFQVSSKSWDS
jgi:hypothetical protein